MFFKYDKYSMLFIFQNLYNFLAQPNVLEHLDISMTDTLLENVSLGIYISLPEAT